MPDDSTFSVVLWVVKKCQILLAPSRVKVSSSDLVGDLFPMVAMKLSVNENQVALWKPNKHLDPTRDGYNDLRDRFRKSNGLVDAFCTDLNGQLDELVAQAFLSPSQTSQQPPRAAKRTAVIAEILDDPTSVVASDGGEEGGESVAATPARSMLNQLPTSLGLISEKGGQPRSQHNQQHGSQQSVIRNMQKQCKSPSTEARPSHLIKTQKKGRVQAIYNGRPPSLQGPHIHPYHTVFSHFQQKLQRPLSTVDFLEKDLLRASHIISDSAAFYGDEEKRQHTLQHWIEAFLGSGALSATAYFSGSQKYRPSGSLRTVCGLYEERRGERDMLKLITEVKNEIGTGNCCPTEQAEKDYQLTCIQPELDDLRRSSCMPAFILAIAGPHISVSGVIFLDGVVSQRLTPLIPLAQSYSDNPRLDEDCMGMVTWGGKHAMEIALLFKSLRESLDELDDYYLTVQKPSDFAPAPHFRSFGEVKLTYLSRLPGDRHPCDRRTIFLAEAHGGGEDGTQCVVKFADRYGRRAHEFMYERGVAARLMHCEEVPSAGGLFAVVTEYVEHKPDAVPSTEGMEKLAKALLELHNKEKLVMGDLRSPNVLVDSSGQPHLIDFDWSGPDGKMRYPGDLNTTDIKWPEGAGPYAFITKEHDVAMLEDLKGFYASKKA